jgi:hypothetical protein
MSLSLESPESPRQRAGCWLLSCGLLLAIAGKPLHPSRAASSGPWLKGYHNGEADLCRRQGIVTVTHDVA